MNIRAAVAAWTAHLKGRAEPAPEAARFQLRLFVAGQSSVSLRTIAALRAFCTRRLPPRVDLEVVDIHQQPALAVRDKVVAVPTLVKLLPLPVRRIIGDLSNESRLLRALGMRAPPDDER